MNNVFRGGSGEVALLLVVLLLRDKASESLYKLLMLLLTALRFPQKKIGRIGCALCLNGCLSSLDRESDNLAALVRFVVGIFVWCGCAAGTLPISGF